MFPAVLLILCGLTAGCGKTGNPDILGTFRMGEKVQMGPLVYTILEAQWKTALTDAGEGRPPKNRYLFVRASVTNGGGTAQPIPAFELRGSNAQTFREVTEGLTDVPQWLGVLRTVQPAQTEQGYVIFDAPMAAYRLAISDGGEPGSEKHALVEMPVQLD